MYRTLLFFSLLVSELPKSYFPSIESCWIYDDRIGSFCKSDFQIEMLSMRQNIGSGLLGSHCVFTVKPLTQLPTKLLIIYTQLLLARGAGRSF